MQRIHIGLSPLVFTAITTLALSARVAAQTVVVGTGNPDIDVPAVQAAVNQGGEVTLRGHFSFDRPPTILTAFPQYPLATVIVSSAVTIAGARDERGNHGDVTTIEGGTIPFYVEAPGAQVSVQGLRFVRPKSDAVLVYAASGRVFASCKIEGVEPDPTHAFSAGIEIRTVGTLPSPANPGHPEAVSGALVIADNEIDLPAASLDSTVGILIFSIGVPGAEVDVYISRNTVTNSTERAINLYQIGGRASVEGNLLTTSTSMGPANILGCRGTDVIHVTGTGMYLVAHNSIHSRWAAAGGIRVDSMAAVWPIVNAVVADNDVIMEAPEDTQFDRCSAGVSVFGPAQGSVVLNNRIRGRAGAALAALAKSAGVPANSALVLNRFDHFQAAVADVFVDDGVVNTRIIGHGTVDDHGIGTVIQPLPNRGRHHEEGGDENRDHTSVRRER